ncbi:hypothetical protein D3C81_2177370 [compost metagenome]
MNGAELILKGGGAQNIDHCADPLLILRLLEHDQIVTFLDQRNEFKSLDNFGRFLSADADIGLAA